MTDFCEGPEDLPGYRTTYSELEGSLEERMAAWLEPLVGLSLSELGGPSLIGRMPLDWRVREGAHVEFSSRARVEFPDLRAVRLVCGDVVAEIGL